LYRSIATRFESDQLNCDLNLPFKLNDLVFEDIPLFRDGFFLNDSVVGVFFLPGNKIYPFVCPPGEHAIIRISPVNGNNGAGSKGELFCNP